MGHTRETSQSSEESVVEIPEPTRGNIESETTQTNPFNDLIQNRKDSTASRPIQVKTGDVV